jgi:hypothetical protein
LQASTTVAARPRPPRWRNSVRFHAGRLTVICPTCQFRNEIVTYVRTMIAVPTEQEAVPAS